MSVCGLTPPVRSAADFLLPLGLLVLGGALLYSRAAPKPAALLLLLAPITVQLGYTMTALPMPVMVLPLVAGLGWVSLLLASPSVGGGAED
jgi:hypothetical protein